MMTRNVKDKSLYSHNEVVRRNGFLPMAAVVTLFVTLGIVSSAFAGDDITNQVSSAEMVIDNVKSYLPEIRGNAIWDFAKLLFVWGLKLIPATALLFMIIVSLFSQRIHVSLFVKGSWRGLLWFSGVKPFGHRVRKDEIKEYRKFSSPSRQQVIDELNRHSGVFIVMGPAGAGKSLLVRAESKAKFVLVVDREDWYDHRKDASPVREILKERTNLLVKHLLGACSKTVCIVLDWDSKTAMPLPSKYWLEKIVDQLMGILSASKKFRKVSFVLTIPAYYQIDSPQFDPECDSSMPELHSIYLLDGSECLSLLDAQLQYKAKNNGFDSLKCRRELTIEARDRGMSLERMIWIESLGKPKQVLKIIGRHQYGSCEVWKSLRDWWKQVYDANDEADCDKDNWLACLYAIALKSLTDGQVVDVESIAKSLFDKRSGSAIEAIKRMCLNHRPRTKDEIGEGKRTSEPRMHAGRLDLRKIDAEHIFEDKYVIESLVGSLGEMDDKPGSPRIFNFADKMHDAVQSIFDFNNPNECENVASAYLATTERLPDLPERLKEQYRLCDRLKEIFGTGGMVAAYERRLKDPTAFRAYVCALISRIGVLPETISRNLLHNIGNTLREKLPIPDYVRLMFEVMPAYVIGRKLPCRWGIDFDALVAVLKDSNCEAGVKRRCALIICVAYANYLCEEIYFKGQIFDIPEIENHRNLVKSAYDTSESMCEHAEWWREITNTLSAMTGEPAEECGFAPCILTSSSDIASAARMMFCYKMNYSPCPRTDTNIELFDALVHDDVALAGENDRLLISFCRSMIPSWYFISEENDSIMVNANIDSLVLGIKDWASCPVAAVGCFKCCCNVYQTIFRDSHAGFFDTKILWDLLGVLREWQKGLSDFWYSQCLSRYAALLSSIPSNEDEVYLKNVWNDFSEIVKAFWQPILSTDRPLEDWAMPKDYFDLYASLSNVCSVKPSMRATLLSEIVPNRIACLWENSDRIGSAWCIYDCDPDLVPPYLKMFWCVQIMVCKDCELQSNDSAGMIRAAEELLQEAREGGVCIDDKLVGLLYEANGLRID